MHQKNSIAITASGPANRLITYCCALLFFAALQSNPALAEPLTLEQAMANALVNNLSIKRQSANLAGLKEQVKLQQSALDTTAFASMNYEDLSRRQNAIEFTSTGELNLNRIFEEENVRARMGLRKRTIYGTVVEAGVETSKLRNTITESGGAAIFSPEYQTNFTVSVMQPLLKNFSKDANLLEVNLAQIAVTEGDFERELVMTNQLIAVINAFYDSLFGQANVASKKQSLEVAKALLRANERRKNAGQMSALDVSVAAVRVAEAEEELWLAESFLNDRKAELSKLLATNTSGTGFSLAGDISLDDSSIDFSSLSAIARKQRPDLLIANAILEQQSLRNDYAKNQALPELNLSIVYGANGLEEATGSSFDEAFDNDENDVRVGLSFEMPLSRRGARASTRSAQFAIEQAKLEVSQLQRNIDIDLKNGISRLGNIQKRIAASERSLALAEQALEAEEKRLSRGQSTTFEVIQLQETVSAARTRVLAGQVDSMKVVNELRAFSGSLLSHYGLKNQKL